MECCLTKEIVGPGPKSERFRIGSAAMHCILSLVTALLLTSSTRTAKCEPRQAKGDSVALACWVLSSGAVRNGGPGTIRLIADPSAETVCMPLLEKARVIHAGDSIVVGEPRNSSSARVSARAQGPAAIGGVFSARIDWSGKVVQLRAIAPGRAEWMSSQGAWK